MKILANRKFFVNSRLKKPAQKLLFVAVMCLFAVFTLLFVEARHIYQRTERALEKERQNQSKQNAIPFSRVVLTPHVNQNVQIIQNTKNVRSVASFQNTIFAATDGGLAQMTENGEILRRFSVLDGLPESDLTALAVFQTKLFIGTRSKGLIAFDGEKFESFRLENHETKAINALFADERALLIGTYSGGLLRFDGAAFSEVKAAEKRIEQPVFIRQTEDCLIAGTFSDGFWIRKDQIWKHLTTADRLPSNRIIGAEIIDNTLFIASDLGISQAFLTEIFSPDQTTFRQVFSVPALASFVFKNDRFYLTKDDGEIFTFSAENNVSALKKVVRKQPENLQSAKFSALNDDIWLMSDQGLWKSKNSGAEENLLVEFGKFPDENEPTNNNISALAFDPNEQLWIGTFRNGIDVFSANGKKLRHLESEQVREINFLTQDVENKEILASTSGGAIRFDKNGRESFFAENDDLPSRAVTQISLFNDAKNPISAISTAKGLFYQDNNSRRIFSAINGLPGNSISAALFAQNSLFVGTMSGLAQIENGKVSRVFKTSNSELKNNWISALCLAGNRIFIGSYGGGIFELLPSGEIRSFATETGKNFVNPNALFSDGERLYAGTLEGVWCLNLTTQVWLQVKDVLPAETVLSISGNRENIYVGTTNGIARINKNFWSAN